MKFDINDVLLRMTYTYSVNGKLDHRYTYAPNKGLISLKKF